MLNSKINFALLAQYGLLASALPTMSPRAQPRIFARDCLPDLKSMTAATVTSPSHKRADASTLAAPAEYTANPSIGGGSGTFKDSAHFRVYGADDSAAEEALTMLEAAHTCFVEEVGWRSPGLSFNSGGVGQEVGPYYKMNVYSVSTGDLPGAAGVMSTDMGAGLPYLQVVSQYLTTPDVLVHEFGHAMHVSEKNWIDQGRTGAWWEPVANFIADLYIATPLCKNAKAAANLPDGPSIIALQKVVGDSFQVLVDGTPESANYYESWPFLSYITNNPDNFAGLSNATLLDMIRKYTIGSNDTPLHALGNLLSDVTIQKLVGRYWARMAYVDIGHAKAQEAFEAQRNTINYANLDGSNGDYTVKSARAPRYMGANIIPLKSSSGTVSVAITSQSLDKVTATLAVKGANGTRYVDVESGKGSVTLESGEEVSLVVANTPELVQYDPFSIPSELNQGLSYSVKIEGATAA